VETRRWRIPLVCAVCFPPVMSFRSTRARLLYKCWCLRNHLDPPQATTIPMSNLCETLHDLSENLSEENYDRSLAQYRFWLDLGVTHGRVGQGQVSGDIGQMPRSELLEVHRGELIHPTAHLFFRFVEDIEDKLTSRASEYHKHRCARAVAGCIDSNISLTKHGGSRPLASFLTTMNLIARWANLGFVGEAVIRNHILQSLISHQKLHDHQADALIILFKLAGATFGTYADPSAVDRCFELLKGRYSPGSAKNKLVWVRESCVR